MIKNNIGGFNERKINRIGFNGYSLYIAILLFRLDKWLFKFISSGVLNVINYLQIVKGIIFRNRFRGNNTLFCATTKINYSFGGL